MVVDTAKVTGGLHGLQMAVPKWSPDGTKIAFIGGLMSDQGSTGGDVWVVSAKGGEPEDVTPKIDGTPGYESWTGNDADRVCGGAERAYAADGLQREQQVGGCAALRSWGGFGLGWGVEGCGFGFAEWGAGAGEERVDGSAGDLGGGVWGV